MSPAPIPSRIGRYDVEGRIGRGGMGVVYRAVDPQIQRTVAIKLINDVDQESRPRFLREMRLLGTLKHPNIVTIYDCGEYDEQPYLVMEYVEGVTLASLIRGGGMSVSRKVELGQQLCQALGYAHGRGIIHRDVKPTNLMVDSDGSLKVLDFGIARSLSATASVLGNLIGTVNYMSPEQLTGQPVDQRSDIFAVGLVLYELFSSTPAFMGDTPVPVMNAVINHEPPPLCVVCPGLDPAIERIVNTAIQKDPGDRYQTLGGLAAALATLASTMPAQVDPGTREADQSEVPTARVSDRLGKTATSGPAAANDSTEIVPPGEPTEVLTPAPVAQTSRPWMRPAFLVAIAALAVSSLVFAWTRWGRAKDDVSSGSQPGQHASGTVDGATTPAITAGATVAPPVATPPATASRGAGSTSALTTPSVGPERGPRDGLPTKDVKVTGPTRATETPIKAAERACESGTSQACADLGSKYLLGEGVTRDLTKASEWFSRGCGGKIGRACYELARLSRDSTGPSRNLATAAALFDKACDLGVADGCSDLGAEYARGIAVVRDDARAATLYTKACDAGSSGGCTSLGRVLWQGRGVAKDLVRARAALQKACDGGDAAGCSDFGNMLNQGLGGDADPARAAALFKRGCDGGFPPGCNLLGQAYARGEGVDRDDNHAAELFRTACDSGGNIGCFNLGRRYLDGLGVPQDFAHAAELFQRACDSAYLPGCNELGLRYLRGEGVVKDDAHATGLFQRACDGNLAPACFNLARQYGAGLGAPRNPARAAELLQRACDGRFEPACNELGLRYQNGDGVSRDDAKAATLFRQACDAGIAPACGNLTRLQQGRGRAARGGRNPPPDIVGGIPGGLSTTPQGPPPAPPPPPPAASPRPAPVRVPPAGAPVRTRYVPPVYPPMARQARIQGAVVIDATIDVNGKIVDARIVRSGNQMLNDAALAAVRQWEYRPAMIGGRAVAVITSVVVSFTLQ